MPHVSPPPPSANASELRVLAHNLHKMLVNGSGTVHARVLKLEAYLGQLASANFNGGVQQGHAQAQIEMKDALTGVHALAAAMTNALPAEHKASLDQVVTGLAMIIANVTAAEKVMEQTQQEAQAAAIPEFTPSPPQGLHLYRVSTDGGGGLKYEPQPGVALHLENCMVWSVDKWVGYAGSNAHLPAWFAARIAPKKA